MHRLETYHLDKNASRNSDVFLRFVFAFAFATRLHGFFVCGGERQIAHIISVIVKYFGFSAGIGELLSWHKYLLNESYCPNKTFHGLHTIDGSPNMIQNQHTDSFSK